MKAINVFFLIINLFLIATGEELRFTNPIFTQNERYVFPDSYGALHLGSYYYLSHLEYLNLDIPNLWIWKSPILTDFRNATRKLIYSSPKLSPGTMHVIDGELYMYARNLMKVQGIYAMKAKNNSDPFGEWEEPVLVIPGEDIDEATVMKHGPKNYLILSKRCPGTTHDVLIAEMITPTEISDNVVPIGKGSHPSCFYNQNVTYLIRTGFNRAYHFTQMSIPFGRIPLSPDNWDYTDVVFVGDEDEGVIAPVHASFVDSPDLSETWMVYSQGVRLDETSLIADKISWNRDGSARFPRAHGPYHSLPVPSGQMFV